MGTQVVKAEAVVFAIVKADIKPPDAMLILTNHLLRFPTAGHGSIGPLFRGRKGAEHRPTDYGPRRGQRLIGALWGSKWSWLCMGGRHSGGRGRWRHTQPYTLSQLRASPGSLYCTGGLCVDPMHTSPLTGVGQCRCQGFCCHALVIRGKHSRPPGFVEIVLGW